MRRFLRPGYLVPVLGLLAGVLGPAAPALAQVNVTINDVSLSEGNAGTTAFNFTINANNVGAMASTAGSVTVNVNDGPAGEAVAGGGQPNNDYVDQNGVVFPIPSIAAMTNQNFVFTVQVNGDTTRELNDDFTVDLSNAVNVVITDAQGIGTILNDDAIPIISIADPAGQNEGDGPNPLYFVVSIDRASYLPISVKATTIPGSATSSPAGPGNPDYSEILNTTYTIPPGATTVPFAVAVYGDSTYEGDETFQVRITNGENAILPDGVQAATGTILNDDTAPTLTFFPGSATICENPVEQHLVTVSLSQASGLPASFNLNVVGSATLNTDYTLQLSGGGNLSSGSTITFAPGETQKTIIITTIDDANVEGNETVLLTANTLVGISAVSNNSTTTIADDESWTVSLEELPNADPLFDPETIGLNGHPLRCFRATVTDNCGNPVQGVTVTFFVDGDTGGQIVGQGFHIINQNQIEVVTNDAGQAEFCYVPQFPGEDEVFASVFDVFGNEVFSGSVFVDVDPPFNTGNAVVAGSGYVDLAEVLVGLLPGPTGVPSFFSLDVRNGRGNRTVGTVNTTLGIALPLGPGGRWVGGTVNLRSVRMLGLIAGQATTGGKRAVAYGIARAQIQVQRQRFVLNNILFRVDALDNGTPGVPNDRFQLTILIEGATPGGDAFARRLQAAGGGKVVESFTLTFGGNLDFARSRGIKNDIDIRNGVIVIPVRPQ